MTYRPCPYVEGTGEDSSAEFDGMYQSLHLAMTEYAPRELDQIAGDARQESPYGQIKSRNCPRREDIRSFILSGIVGDRLRRVRFTLRRYQEITISASG